jgi:hypothetical protein
MLSKYVEEVYKKIVSIKRVSQPCKAKDVENVLKYIDNCNSLGEFDEVLDGVPITKILIPSKLGQLIYPRTVRIDTADRGDKDFLVRNDHLDDAPKYADFIESCDRIASTMKTSIFSFSSLDDLRKNVGFVSVYRQSVNSKGRVVYDGSNPYIPIPLSFDAVEERARTFSVDEIISDFIQWKLPELFR